MVQDGSVCEGAVGTTEDIELNGLPVVFACPASFTTVEVGVTMLLDRDQRYRTLGFGPDGQGKVYDAGDRVHTWPLGTAGENSGDRVVSEDRRASAAVQIGGLLAGLAALAGAGWWWSRRRPARRGGMYR